MPTERKESQGEKQRAVTANELLPGDPEDGRDIGADFREFGLRW